MPRGQRRALARAQEPSGHRLSRLHLAKPRQLSSSCLPIQPLKLRKRGFDATLQAFLFCRSLGDSLLVNRLPSG